MTPVMKMMYCPICNGKGTVESTSFHWDDVTRQWIKHQVVCAACSGAGMVTYGVCEHGNIASECEKCREEG